MPKRTTFVLNDNVYETLVSESIKRYGSARNLSRVVNEMVEERSAGDKSDIMELIYSEKVAKTSQPEIESFRRRLSATLDH